MTDRPPNIVLVVLDSVRRDHLSCYGYDRRTTPAIDRIAEEGTRYTRAYAASCWTIPSHASIFTGLYPSRHRADFDTQRLDPGHPTIAGWLRDRGYRTACFTCNGFIGPRTNLDAGFEVSVDTDGLRGSARGLPSRLVRGVHRRWRAWTARDRGARRATRLARRWLEEMAGGPPFFLFLNYMDCHLPYRLRGSPRWRFVPREDRRRVRRLAQDPYAWMAGRPAPSSRDVEDLRALYDAGLRFLDDQVASIDQRLAALGLRERTVLAVTSDHGESFGEHGLFDHQYGLHEALIAVPLVVRYPDRALAGSTDLLVHHVDLFPTFAELANGGGASLPSAGAPGRSLLDGRRDIAFAEYLVPNLRAFERRFPDLDVAPFDVRLRAAFDGKYKLIRRSDGGRHLYHLASDPEERRDLAAVAPTEVARLDRALESQLGGWPSGSAEVFDGDGLEVEVRRRLEALGYL